MANRASGGGFFIRQNNIHFPVSAKVLAEKYGYFKKNVYFCS